MADDRNLTSHTYNEKLAEQIFQKLPEYVAIVKFWINSMEKKLKKTGTVGSEQSANFFHFFYKNCNAMPSRKRDIDLSTKITSLELNTACFFTALRVGLRLYYSLTFNISLI